MENDFFFLGGEGGKRRRKNAQMIFARDDVPFDESKVVKSFVIV